MRASCRPLLICALATSISLAVAEPDAPVLDDVIAVNVLLVPDQQTIALAQRINRDLRQTYPAGFALDASHVPHISVLHGYVRSKDLTDVYGAVRKVTLQRSLIGRHLAVNGLEHQPWNGEELTNIKIAKTPELDAFQAALIAAVSPYFSGPGDSSAFVTSKEDSDIDQQTIEYVRTFVQKHTGSEFKPHITVGISSVETAQKISALQTPPAKVTIDSVALFQLGNVGTARKELWRYSP
jgi:2'-5' RNA ligase